MNTAPDFESIKQINILGREYWRTDAKLKRDQITEEDAAILTHHDVGLEVRHAIENIYQRKPEDLPRAASIRKLVEEKRRRTCKKLKEALPEEQGKFF